MNKGVLDRIGMGFARVASAAASMALWLSAHPEVVAYVLNLAKKVKS